MLWEPKTGSSSSEAITAIFLLSGDNLICEGHPPRTERDSSVLLLISILTISSFTLKSGSSYNSFSNGLVREYKVLPSGVIEYPCNFFHVLLEH